MEGEAPSTEAIYDRGDQESFVGSKFRTPSLYSHVVEDTRTAVQVMKRGEFNIDIWQSPRLNLELQLVPFSKRLYVRINRRIMMDLCRFAKIEFVKEEDGSEGTWVLLEFEDGRCSCQGNISLIESAGKCEKHLLLRDCNMDVFSQGLVELGKHWELHYRFLQQENERIIDAYQDTRRHRAAYHRRYDHGRYDHGYGQHHGPEPAKEETPVAPPQRRSPCAAQVPLPEEPGPEPEPERDNNRNSIWKKLSPMDKMKKGGDKRSELKKGDQGP